MFDLSFVFLVAITLLSTSVFGGTKMKYPVPSTVVALSPPLRSLCGVDSFSPSHSCKQEILTWSQWGIRSVFRAREDEVCSGGEKMALGSWGRGAVYPFSFSLFCLPYSCRSAISSELYQSLWQAPLSDLRWLCEAGVASERFLALSPGTNKTDFM